jgi:molybdopterin molybdotransferase
MPRTDATAADWLSIAEAREAVLRVCRALPAESRARLDALGHVLAEPVVAPLDLPPWDNSAMDGFAVRAVDLPGASEAAPRELRIIDDIAAGAMPARAIGPGEAARIMTGAPMPPGADSVVRIEHTDGGREIGTPARVRIRSAADAGRNVRRRGEDLRQGDAVLAAGTVLGAAQLGVAASVGCAELRVVRRPRVAVLASGDELVEVDDFAEVLAGRRIVSSNSYTLAARLAEIGCEAQLLGIARDDPADLAERLEAARGCDALVTTAGVSVGEHDYLRDVLREMGAEIDFWRVRMRPGSPFGFGRIGALDGMPWFGLPGNPVSTLVTFELFVRPALLRMAGHTAVFPPTVPARLLDDYPAPPGLTHFARVRLHAEPDGGHTVSLTGAQGSGILTSMATADALLVVPPEPGGARAGAVLPAIVLGGAPLRDSPGY